MRLRDQKPQVPAEYKIIVIDDEIGVIDSIKVLVDQKNYEVKGFINPLEGIEQIKKESFDLLILDYAMQPINGDQVVKEIRTFNQELYILMLTGYQDIASPVETLKFLDIQGYCEKRDDFDQLYLLIESAFKSVKQTRMIKKFHQGLDSILTVTPELFELKTIESLLQDILIHLAEITETDNKF